MLLFLLIVLAMCFAISLLPFVFPGALISAFGLALNHWLGGILANSLGLGHGALVTGSGAAEALSLSGVLAIYLPLLLILVFFLRGR